MSSPDNPYIMYGKTPPSPRDLEEECRLWKQYVGDTQVALNQNALRAREHENSLRSQVTVATLKRVRAHLDEMIQATEKSGWAKQDHE